MAQQNTGDTPLPSNQILLGGQAVIEGVMMRGPERIALAVRRADGTITVRTEGFVPLAMRKRIWAFPLLRGVSGFFEMMLVGIRMLNVSASLAMRDLADDSSSPGSGRKEKAGTIIAVVISLAFAVGLFFVIPLLVTTAMFQVSQDPLRFNLLAGLIRLAIFLAYLAAIARIPDVKRLFMYHGAEHMTVFGYERMRQVSVEAARIQSRFHPRCGTSFLLIVVVASIVLFAVADSIVIASVGVITVPLRLLWHLLLLPLVAGASYEVIRFSAKYSWFWVGRLITLPGLWLQRLTTRPPTEDQLEVAVAALDAALDVRGEDLNGHSAATSELKYA